jgi:uncharacterized membrane protein
MPAYQPPGDDAIMDNIQPYLDPALRWIHIVAGILWIGLLYFFNWVNAVIAPKLDAESKKKVLPELLPRALYWFRWGAAWTWTTGVLLLAVLYYHGKLMWEGGVSAWGLLPGIMVAVTFFGVFLYDVLAKTVLKDPKAAFIGGWVLLSALYYFYRMQIPEVGYRGANIHLGGMLGTFMAFNVWFRIWPAQQKVITAIKAGTPPDAAAAGLAGLRSKHNTYMSFALVFTMINLHTIELADKTWAISVVILVGWLACYLCYQKSKSVPGF